MTAADRTQAPDPYSRLPQVPSFELTSTGFADGDELPGRHGFADENLSPALAWSGAPEGTKSFLVSCFDPDAPTPSGFWHWFAVGVPADVSSLEQGAGSASGSLPAGVLQLRNDYGSADFGGAAPRPGTTRTATSSPSRPSTSPTRPRPASMPTRARPRRPSSRWRTSSAARPSPAPSRSRADGPLHELCEDRCGSCCAGPRASQTS